MKTFWLGANEKKFRKNAILFNFKNKIQQANQSEFHIWK